MPSLFQILSALSAAIGLVSGYIQIREAIRAHPGTPPQRQRFTWIVTITAFFLTIVFLGASLAPPVTPAPSSNTSSSTTPQLATENAPTQAASVPTAIPSPTPIPKPEPGAILYQADQSWNGWNGSGGWNVSSSGTLINNGSNTDPSFSPTIVAPYSLEGIADYAVEIRMQLVTTLDPNITYGTFPSFSIRVRSTSTSQGREGYDAGFYAFYPPFNAWIKGAQDQSVLTSAPFDPKKTAHTYRVEVKGNTVKFLIDGGLTLQITDLRYSSGGQVGFACYQLQLAVSSFKIIAL